MAVAVVVVVAVDGALDVSATFVDVVAELVHAPDTIVETGERKRGRDRGRVQASRDRARAS